MTVKPNRPSVFEQIEALRAGKPVSQKGPFSQRSEKAQKSENGRANTSKSEAKARLEKSNKKEGAKAFWGDRTNNDRLKILLDKSWERLGMLWANPVRHIRGSKVGDACPRYMTFQAAGFEVPAPAQRRRIWAVGKAIEEVVIASMKRAGIWVDDDVEIRYEWPPVLGHVDVVVRIEGRDYMGEIKSINTRGFSDLPAEEGTMEKPVPAGKLKLLKAYRGYVMQLNTYLCAPDAPSDQGFFLFEDKNNQSQKVYWVAADHALQAGRLETAKAAGEYILMEPQHIAPVPEERDPVGGDAVCGKCEARDLCTRMPQEAFPIALAREAER